MSTPAIIMWLTVAVVAVSFSLGRNPTAAALVVSWSVGEMIWLATGNPLPVSYYPFLDIAVLAVIACKPPYRRWQPRGAWERLQGIILDRSPADRAVVLVFPIMWLIYVAPLHPYYAWWSLWLLAIIQFLAAGWESLSKFRRSRAVSDTPDSPSGDEFCRLAWGRGYG